jgi:hypothetical protein
MKIVFLVVSLIAACYLVVDLFSENMETGSQLADCRADLDLATLSRDQLLSKGKFVRRYDPKTGFSEYRFQPPAAKTK